MLNYIVLLAKTGHLWGAWNQLSHYLLQFIRYARACSSYKCFIMSGTTYILESRAGICPGTFEIFSRELVWSIWGYHLELAFLLMLRPVSSELVTFRTFSFEYPSVLLLCSLSKVRCIDFLCWHLITWNFRNKVHLQNLPGISLSRGNGLPSFFQFICIYI